MLHICAVFLCHFLFAAFGNTKTSLTTSTCPACQAIKNLKLGIQHPTSTPQIWEQTLPSTAGTLLTHILQMGVYIAVQCSIKT